MFAHIFPGEAFFNRLECVGLRVLSYHPLSVWNPWILCWCCCSGVTSSWGDRTDIILNCFCALENFSENTPTASPKRPWGSLGHRAMETYLHHIATGDTAVLLSCPCCGQHLEPPSSLCAGWGLLPSAAYEKTLGPGLPCPGTSGASSGKAAGLPLYEGQMLHVQSWCISSLSDVGCCPTWLRRQRCGLPSTGRTQVNRNGLLDWTRLCITQFVPSTTENRCLKK